MIVCMCLVPSPALGVTLLLDQPVCNAENGVGFTPFSCVGLIGGVARTSGMTKGLAAVAVDNGGELSGEREGRGPIADIVGDREGAA